MGLQKAVTIVREWFIVWILLLHTLNYICSEMLLNRKKISLVPYHEILRLFHLVPHKAVVNSCLNTGVSVGKENSMSSWS